MNKTVKGLKPLSEKQRRELEALAAMDEETIDTSDIPEALDIGRGETGKFYRPIKKSLHIRLDADVLAWLKAQGPGYQTRINAMLRKAMFEQYLSRSRAPKKPGRKSA